MKATCFNSIYAALILTGLATPVLAQEIFSPSVDKSGNISFPADYRSTMEHLGSWFVPTGEPVVFTMFIPRGRASSTSKKTVFSPMAQFW
ncbi:hypothetical protein [Shewanella woodyi]|uniref:hypothetical protein n=1 Tax=Shewanella woodyi TaxID=60961 RepID=UPI003747A089